MELTCPLYIWNKWPGQINNMMKYILSNKKNGGKWNLEMGQRHTSYKTWASFYNRKQKHTIWVKRSMDQGDGNECEWTTHMLKE